MSIATQKALREVPAPISIVANKIENLVVRDKIDFTGPYGTYYREIFFHIPFLLANHLNSQGKYAEAQKWYHYIFNPGATEVIDFSAPGLSPAEKKKMALDRNWQYLEFRDIDAQKLRDQLNDKQAIEVYKKDPFNPHAIARLRMSAYQKSIVMKYIDNLLDWGDQLFTQDSMESINQATLLYVIAKEILGDRPAEIGDCGEGKVRPKTYEKIAPILAQGSERFSNLGLYTWLSSTMQGLFKEAYNNALSIARLAEQAYKYERDDTNIFIDGTYFDASRAGLLSGERLQMALQTMERRYLETNYRKSEIDQPFSLTQIDPAALLLLKETGTCDFSIPEVFFDLFYPGQYRRKIQSVRLTIPSVTGPYTNVSATLSLTSSEIRMEPQLGAAALQSVPKARTTTIATSTAQNDAGVFQLNFRDDRYMPFEGSGAISSWKLSLPKNFRQFDYSTINDVIIHISYVADYDELFRDRIEQQNGDIQGTLLNVLKNQPLSRTFSFRQEFSHDFHRLTEQPVGQPILVKIQNKHFPLFMNGRTLKVTKARLILVTSESQTVAGADIRIDGASQTGFPRDPALGNLFSKDLGTLFNGGIVKDHTISIVAGGDLAPAPAAGPASAIDTEKLEDIILYVEYKIG